MLKERASDLCGNQSGEHHHAFCKSTLSASSHEDESFANVGNIFRLNSLQVEEEKPEIVIKEKKEKRSKGWGRRSTRAKKTISYRSV